jgi:hypothetical protein
LCSFVLITAVAGLESSSAFQFSVPGEVNLPPSEELSCEERQECPSVHSLDISTSKSAERIQTKKKLTSRLEERYLVSCEG